MMEGGGLNLRESLRLADSLLNASAAAVAYGLAATLNDPLRLNLPPLVGAGALTPEPPVLKAITTLYMQAEMEQAGVVAVAEVLADSRYQLAVRSPKSAKLLEDFHDRRRDWLDRNSREHVFARLFGFGSLARMADGPLVNRDFQTRFANFCLALRRCGEELQWQATVSPTLDAALRLAAIELLVNLGGRGTSDAYEAARRIQTQLAKAIELLSDEGIGGLFQARGMWQLLRVVLGDAAPDFARLSTRGQSGLRLLDWLAGALPNLADKKPRKPLLEAASPVVPWAEMWLEATGFGRQQAALRRAA
jgi:hypothetical protein